MKAREYIQKIIKRLGDGEFSIATGDSGIKLSLNLRSDKNDAGQYKKHMDRNSDDSSSRGKNRSF